ncbi:hypothetical protein DVV91_10120 [Clostridium botulinum]|uniref:macro domain-containing protein n=1 Tax=Clostridium botulinum TaxID=1491 RepID=UPI0019675746|nr:macro domain-containing protein [Clostridium botulinum]MBN1074697.1 hypothetical protein [Clostridium botulinum]
MKFNEQKGNLFELDNEKYAYVHCISSDCEMGKGIAVEFKNKYKGMQKYLREKVENAYKSYPLCIPAIRNKDNKVLVLFLVTKNKYWNKPTYDTLRTTLIDMRDFCFRHNVKYLAMPKIGCGLDRLQWGKVREIIKELFDDTDIVIEVRYL